MHSSKAFSSLTDAFLKKRDIIFIDAGIEPHLIFQQMPFFNNFLQFILIEIISPVLSLGKPTKWVRNLQIANSNALPISA